MSLCELCRETAAPSGFAPLPQLQHQLYLMLNASSTSAKESRDETGNNDQHR
eukprot:gene17223-20642_t